VDPGGCFRRESLPPGQGARNGYHQAPTHPDQPGQKAVPEIVVVNHHRILLGLNESRLAVNQKPSFRESIEFLLTRFITGSASILKDGQRR
jgi:hypothetical protein